MLIFIMNLLLNVHYLGVLDEVIPLVARLVSSLVPLNRYRIASMITRNRTIAPPTIPMIIPVFIFFFGEL